jgi:hypothetical protein
MSTNRAGLGAYAAVGLGNYFALSQGAAATVGTAVGSYLIPAAAVGYTVWRGYQGYKVAKAYMEQNDYTCAGL